MVKNKKERGKQTMSFKRIRQLLLAGALLTSLSHTTVASAEEPEDTSKMSIVLAEAMNETTDNTTDSSSNTDDLYEEAESLLEGFSEEELNTIISNLESKDTLELEEEVLLEASTDSMEETAKSALDDYYENTDEGMKDKASQIVRELSIDETKALINSLENKEELSQEEKLLLKTSQSAMTEVNAFYIITSIFIGLLFGSIIAASLF